MEKIKRWEFAEELGTCRGPVNPEYKCGQFIKHEDHISALKEIFPDWPGEYPTEMGNYYFRCTDGFIEPRFVDFMDEVPVDIFGTPISEYSDPEQWGPSVPMWRKI